MSCIPFCMPSSFTEVTEDWGDGFLRTVRRTFCKCGIECSYQVTNKWEKP